MIETGSLSVNSSKVLKEFVCIKTSEEKSFYSLLLKFQPRSFGFIKTERRLIASKEA